MAMAVALGLETEMVVAGVDLIEEGMQAEGPAIAAAAAAMLILQRMKALAAVNAMDADGAVELRSALIRVHGFRSCSERERERERERTQTERYGRETEDTEEEEERRKKKKKKKKKENRAMDEWDACMHACMWARVHSCMCACGHVCIHACVHAGTCAFMHVCMRACVACNV
jgi:hypothetical protein